MKCGARVALGVAGGYLLGRTKKMKLALMLGSMVAGRRAGGPGALVGQASKLLGESPEIERLSEELRARLVEAAKGAVLAVAARQVESLADRLSQRLGPVADVADVAEAPRSAVQETVQSDEDRQHEPAAGSDEYDAEPDAARSTGGEEEEPAPPPRRPRPRTPTARAPAGAATATLKRTSAATGSAGRAAAKATTGRKGGRTARSRGSGSDD